MRLNIENNYAFVKMVKLAILFVGIVKYCPQVALECVGMRWNALECVETFA